MQRPVHTCCIYVFFFYYFSNIFIIISCLPRKIRLIDQSMMRYLWILIIKLSVLKLYMYEVNVERAWCCLCQEREFADSAAHPNPGAEFGARIGHVLLQVPKVCCKTRTSVIARLVNYFEYTICTPVHACDTLVTISLTFNYLAIPILNTVLRSKFFEYLKKKQENDRSRHDEDYTTVMKIGLRWMTCDESLWISCIVNGRTMFTV